MTNADDSPLFPRDEPPILTVSELNRMARRALEAALPLLWVEGEVSNFTAAASGHWYFSLKDASAQVRCVMFRGRNQFAEFTPANGDHVEIRALPSLYEARGEFQLGAEAIRRAGAGQLYEAFLKLKAKLETEGLFDAGRKRPLPAFPRCLGIVTSPQAAALQDVLTVLARRMPGLPVILYPAPVQGQGAAARIAAAIRLAGQRQECDVLLVCRGGGSLEDLWAFNDETVARAIAASPVPVVSGVGHETDFTLADFAADVRAPTPTAAAELASPERHKLTQHLDRLDVQMRRNSARSLSNQMQRLDLLARRLLHPSEQIRRQQARLDLLTQQLRGRQQTRHAREESRLHQLGARLSSPTSRILREHQRIQSAAGRMRRATLDTLARRELTLSRLQSNLSHLNPEGVLARGYSIVQDDSDAIVRNAATLRPADRLHIRFHRGRVDAEVRLAVPEPGADAPV